MAHLANLDTRYMVVVGVTVGLIALVCDMALRTLNWGSVQRRSDSKGKSGGGILIILLLVVAVLAPLAAKAVQMAVSRQREYLADATSVQFTRNPTGLISALGKLAEKAAPFPGVSRATQHLFIVNPIHQFTSRTPALLATHPDIADRIARLRNLGGIIIIDFIDMSQADHREAVLNELNKNLARDHVRTNVNSFSSLGLIEMTRKRTRESLSHILCEPCAICNGKGEVKTPQTVCYEILREIVREHRQFNPKEFRIVASPDVIDLFLEEENQFLAMLGDFVQKPIRLQAEAGFKQEQYDIVLN